MTTNVSLKSSFAESKEKLSNILKEYVLPKDVQQVQKAVGDHLNELFENENGFRQNLTESEDYILQSAIRLLQAQQNISIEIARSAKNTQTSEKREGSFAKNKTPNPYSVFAGAGVGAFAGGLLSTWAAVVGAIAGTAVAIYCVSKSQHSDSVEHTNTKVSGSTIDAEVFVGIVENICECVDGIIDTYRVQVKRIKDIYEQREKPSLQADYSALLEQVTNVYNSSKCSVETVPGKVLTAIDLMAESLENYGLRIENGKIVND